MPVGGDVARAPQVIASLALAASGVGINSETHQALLTAPNAGNLASFSLLDNSVNTISFQSNGVTVNQLGFVAAGGRSAGKSRHRGKYGEFDGDDCRS